MRWKSMKLIQFSIAHFVVDFTCIFFLYRTMGIVDSVLSIYVLYNFFAFAMQMPVGLLADRIQHNIWIAVGGCSFIAVAYGITIFVNEAMIRSGGYPLLIVILLGMGNCCYHVGAGKEVLEQSEGKDGPLGFFISTGAFGIYFGAMLSYLSAIQNHHIIVLLLLLSSGMLLLEHKEKKSNPVHSSEPVSFTYPEYRKRLFQLGCLFLVVCLRSYLGSILCFGWKDANWGAMLVIAVVAGKMAGGLLSDRYGRKLATSVSLGAALVLFLFSKHPLPGISAVFFFNMTMPITLGEAARILHKSKGLAFGTLTFALFLGSLLSESKVSSYLQTPVGYSVLTLISLFLLLLGVKKEKTV